MTRQPGGDTEWAAVLAHRPASHRPLVAQRFVASGVTPEAVRAALGDLGQELCKAAQRSDEDWARAFGGHVSVALLAAEVSALAAYLNSRAAAIRGRAVEELLEDYSAVTVASRLGVSRQKVYEIARIDPSVTCLELPRGDGHG
jgi:hypothetical protein